MTSSSLEAGCLLVEMFDSYGDGWGTVVWQFASDDGGGDSIPGFGYGTLLQSGNLEFGTSRVRDGSLFATTTILDVQLIPPPTPSPPKANTERT